MYYIFIENDKINGCGQCKCLNDNIQNIEVTEEVYNDIDRYIWNGEAIILDPDYEEKQRQKGCQRRNQEIDSKIKELSDMASVEMIKGNTVNVQTYKEVIKSLEQSKERIL